MKGLPVLDDEDAAWTTRAMLGLRTKMNASNDKKWGGGDLEVDMGRPTMRGTPPWRPSIDETKYINFQKAVPKEMNTHIPTHGEKFA